MRNPHEDLARARQIQYSLCRKDLGLFTQCSWKILEPETPLLWNWHHDLICEHLAAFRLGQIRRLVINIAPRTTKSTLASVCFPDWVWTEEPKKRFLFGSYAASLAVKHSVLRRNLIESDWYQQGYSSVFRLSSDVNTKSEFTNDKTGQMRASGIKSPPTGEGGDYIVIDDAHNPKSALSDADRETTIEQFDLGWSNRLNDKKNGGILAIMQRLDDRDLTAHLLGKNLGYVHLKIPTIAEEREKLIFPISKRIVIRESGDLLHHERDGPEQIEMEKKSLGPYGFSAQHQQNPTPKTGGLFTEDMFDELAPPDLLEYRFITADTAYGEKKENDFTVFSAWGVADGELYLLDVWRKQIHASKIEEQCLPFIRRFSQYGFRGCYIEPKGHGIYLNKHLPSHDVIIPSDTKINDFFADRRWDKVARANNAAPHLANRRVHINPMIFEREILLTEALRFPKAKHDDFVDTLIDAIKLAFGSGVGVFSDSMVQSENTSVLIEDEDSVPTEIEL